MGSAQSRSPENQDRPGGKDQPFRETWGRGLGVFSSSKSPCFSSNSNPNIKMINMICPYKYHQKNISERCETHLKQRFFGGCYREKCRTNDNLKPCMNLRSGIPTTGCRDGRHRMGFCEAVAGDLIPPGVFLGPMDRQNLWQIRPSRTPQQPIIQIHQSSDSRLFTVKIPPCHN